MKNNERILIKILKELSNELGFSVNAYAYDWIIAITHAENTFYINGYHFDINPAAATKICDDKSGLSEILSAAGLDCVLHHFFMNTANIYYIGQTGNWERLSALLKQYKKLVMKPNIGSSGEDVFLVNSQLELEAAANTIFNKAQNLAVSEFIEIEREYRVLVLDGEVLLIYSKNIPCYLNDLGEEVPIGWKFNLEQGAIPEILEDETVFKQLSQLALSAMNVIGMKFASVDIADTGNGFKIMEINSGVMMENFARISDHNYEIAKGIYQKAVEMSLR